MRLQLALNVKNLEEAIGFYSKLFNTEVNKRKPGYANFAIEEPPLKLVLFEDPNAEERLNHLGVEVFSDEDVHSATDRLKAAGMADKVEDDHSSLQVTEELDVRQDPEDQVDIEDSPSTGEALDVDAALEELKRRMKPEG